MVKDNLTSLGEKEHNEIGSWERDRAQNGSHSQSRATPPEEHRSA